MSFRSSDWADSSVSLIPSMSSHWSSWASTRELTSPASFDTTYSCLLPWLYSREVSFCVGLMLADYGSFMWFCSIDFEIISFLWLATIFDEVSLRRDESSLSGVTSSIDSATAISIPLTTMILIRVSRSCLTVSRYNPQASPIKGLYGILYNSFYILCFFILCTCFKDGISDRSISWHSNYSCMTSLDSSCC